MSTTPAATTNSVHNDDATTHEIDSSSLPSSLPSSLQCDQESIPSIENKDCEYLKLVMGFKRTLVLPDVFFSYEIPVCYCPLCVSYSSSDHSCVKGQFASIFVSQIRLNTHVGRLTNEKKMCIFQVGSDSKSITLSQMPINVRHLAHQASIRAVVMNGQPHSILHASIKFVPFLITVNRCQSVRIRCHSTG